MNRLFYSLFLLSFLTLILLSGCNVVMSLFNESESYKLIIEPANKHVPLGDSVYYTLYKVDSSTNDYTNISHDARWISSNSDIATIYSAGYVDTYINGSVTITAKYEDKSISTGLTIGDYNPQPTPELSLEPTPELSQEPTPESSPSPIPGLIAEYKFDGTAFVGNENEGNVMDLSGNGNPATAHGVSSAIDRFGGSSGAAYFNGSNSYVETPLIWDSPMSFTICVWINVASLVENEHMIMGNCSDTEETWNGFWFQIHYGNHRFHNAVNIINEPFEFSKDSWYHIVYAYDINEHRLTLYVDGTYITDTEMFYTNYSAVSANYIGAIGSGNIVDYFFTGAMDDIMIYNRALTSTEVYSIYTLPASTQ